MILSKIKHYLQEQHVASLYDLTLYFNTDKDTMRNMLEQWIRKGCVKKSNQSKNKCHSCQQCDLLMTELYEWISEPKE